MGKQRICAHCGDVVGAYERAVVVEMGKPREVSMLNEPRFGVPTGKLFHASCWEEAKRGPRVN